MRSDELKQWVDPVTVDMLRVAIGHSGIAPVRPTPPDGFVFTGVMHSTAPHGLGICHKIAGCAHEGFDKPHVRNDACWNGTPAPAPQKEYEVDSTGNWYHGTAPQKEKP